MFKKRDELFFKVKASPFFWRQKAEELKFAAKIIWPYAEERYNRIVKSAKEKSELDINSLDPDTFSIYLSLSGFSTEALFKGVIIRDNPSFVSNGKLSSKLTTHDLIKLSKLAKIALSQNEGIFCRQAYRAMIIESRYPIPKDIGDTNHSMEIGGHCMELFNGLYDRLYPTIGQIGVNKKRKTNNNKQGCIE